MQAQLSRLRCVEPAEYAFYDALVHGVDLPDVRLEDLLRRPEWMERAACRGMDTSKWFPTRGEPSEPAKTVCAGCCVRQECADFALEQAPAPVGIWGGLSERGRRQQRNALAVRARRRAS